mmetsp:Transcript_12809/g.21981  ORF Transcript_12809/g.21981 Transcript_12809/m.21981 type:complete len:1022 (+) Transcript_12809:907-3972(+)
MNRRPRIPFTEQEIANLVEGVEKFKDARQKWRKILSQYEFNARRTSVDLKDKWRNIVRLDPTKRGDALFGHQKIQWSDMEVHYLKQGFSELGQQKNPWASILQRYRNKFHEVRTSVHLKDKWRNLVRDVEREEQNSDYVSMHLKDDDDDEMEEHKMDEDNQDVEFDQAEYAEHLRQVEIDRQMLENAIPDAARDVEMEDQNMEDVDQTALSAEALREQEELMREHQKAVEQTQREERLLREQEERRRRQQQQVQLQIQQKQQQQQQLQQQQLQQQQLQQQQLQQQQLQQQQLQQRKQQELQQQQQQQLLQKQQEQLQEEQPPTPPAVEEEDHQQRLTTVIEIPDEEMDEDEAHHLQAVEAAVAADVPMDVSGDSAHHHHHMDMDTSHVVDEDTDAEMEALRAAQEQDAAAANSALAEDGAIDVDDVHHIHHHEGEEDPHHIHHHDIHQLADQGGVVHDTAEDVDLEEHHHHHLEHGDDVEDTIVEHHHLDDADADAEAEALHRAHTEQHLHEAGQVVSTEEEHMVEEGQIEDHNDEDVKEHMRAVEQAEQAEHMEHVEHAEHADDEHHHLLHHHEHAHHHEADAAELHVDEGDEHHHVEHTEEFDDDAEDEAEQQHQQHLMQLGAGNHTVDQISSDHQEDIVDDEAIQGSSDLAAVDEAQEEHERQVQMATAAEESEHLDEGKVVDYVDEDEEEHRRQHEEHLAMLQEHEENAHTYPTEDHEENEVVQESDIVDDEHLHEHHHHHQHHGMESGEDEEAVHRVEESELPHDDHQNNEELIHQHALEVHTSDDNLRHGDDAQQEHTHQQEHQLELELQGHDVHHHHQQLQEDGQGQSQHVQEDHLTDGQGQDQLEDQQHHLGDESGVESGSQHQHHQRKRGGEGHESSDFNEDDSDFRQRKRAKYDPSANEDVAQGTSQSSSNNSNNNDHRLCLASNLRCSSSSKHLHYRSNVQSKRQNALKKRLSGLVLPPRRHAAKPSSELQQKRRVLRQSNARSVNVLRLNVFAKLQKRRSESATRLLER